MVMNRRLREFALIISNLLLRENLWMKYYFYDALVINLCQKKDHQDSKIFEKRCLLRQSKEPFSFYL